MSCPHTVSLGAYLLGALDPGERSNFERHLADCMICRTEMLRLAPLPGLLGQVSLTDIQEPSEPDPQPAFSIRSLDSEPEPEQPRPGRRWALLAAGVLVVLLIAAGVLVPRLLDDPATPAAPLTWSATDEKTGVGATAWLVKHPWGTEVQLELAKAPPGLRCKLVVHDAGGRTEIGGWWGTSYTDGERVPGSSSFEVDQVDHLEVIADMRVLVTLRPPH